MSDETFNLVKILLTSDDIDHVKLAETFFENERITRKQYNKLVDIAAYNRTLEMTKARRFAYYKAWKSIVL